MKWPWSRPEVRSSSFTDQVIARIMASASGATDGGALAVIETCARWWGSGLASATVKPDNLALRSVTPSILDSIGRNLCRVGESLFMIDVRQGKVSLTPCGQWSVHGTDDPASWFYRVELSGPDTSRTITLPGASVLHVRIAPHPARPWAGRSPVQLAIDTARAAGLLEHALIEEMSFTQKQILSPRRNPGEYGMSDLEPTQLNKIVEAFSAHTGSGAFVVPGDLEPRRLGPEPPDSFPLLREKLENAMYAMHGIPPALVAANANGTAQRESYRQVLHALIKPLGAIVIQEIKEKIDPDAEIDFSALRAGDIMSTSRAFGSLVKAGVSPKSAAAAVGLDIEVTQ